MPGTTAGAVAASLSTDCTLRFRVGRRGRAVLPFLGVADEVVTAVLIGLPVVTTFGQRLVTVGAVRFPNISDSPISAGAVKEV